LNAGLGDASLGGGLRVTGLTRGVEKASRRLDHTTGFCKRGVFEADLFCGMLEPVIWFRRQIRYQAE